MNPTLSSQQVKLVGLLGVLAIAAVAWWMLVARQTAESTAPAVALPVHTKQVAPAAPTHQARAAHRGAKSHAAPVKIARHGLPMKVAVALTRHRVVVVSLSIPGASVDRLVSRESAAGAKAANAGFVSLDVVRQREGGPLLTKLGVIDPPAVLVVRRRGSSVFAQFHGFVDRDTVAQAVADARR